MLVGRRGDGSCGHEQVTPWVPPRTTEAARKTPPEGERTSPKREVVQEMLCQTELEPDSSDAAPHRETDPDRVAQS